MTTPFLHEERRGRIAILTMDRAESMNAIGTIEDCDNIVDTFFQLGNDRSVSAIVLTGAGRAFCTGGNIKGIRDRQGIGPLDQPDSTAANYRRGVQRATRAMLDCDVPMIAAINGHAIGLGLDLACVCDMRVAAEDAVFGVFCLCGHRFRSVQEHRGDCQRSLALCLCADSGISDALQPDSESPVSRLCRRL